MTYERFAARAAKLIDFILNGNSLPCTKHDATQTMVYI